MPAVSNVIARLRRQPPAPATVEALPATDYQPRSPEQMIAGCEYELRQVRRDVLMTRQQPTAPPAPQPREPFVLGSGLRARAAS